MPYDTVSFSLLIEAARMRRDLRDADAISLLEHALTLGNPDPVVAVELARALNATGRSMRALHVLRTARRRWRDRADVCHVAGVAYQLLDDRIRSVRCYARSLRLEPGHAESSFNLTMLLGGGPEH